MANIEREYDDETLIQKLSQIRPGIFFGDATTVQEISMELPESRANYRDLRIELSIPLTAEEYRALLSEPGD
jgi:hypothetical protein